MRRGLVRSCAAAGAALALLPLSARADTVSGTASASTAALGLSVDPTALLDVPAADLAALPASVRSLLTTALQPVTVQIDGANATASRSGAADLVAGHSDATPVSLNLASLSLLLSELHSALSQLAGGVAVPSLASTLSSLATLTSNSAVMALLPSSLQTQLQTLDTELTSLSAKLTALSSDATASVDALQATLVQQLGSQLQYATGLQADISTAHPTGQVQSSAALTVPPQVSLPPLVPAMPVLAQLAPFGATAVTSAGAVQFGAAGPQASSNEATTSFDVAPALDLTDLRSDMAAITTLLSQVDTTASAIQPQLAAVASTIALALPGGLDLTTLIADVSAATAPAGALNTLVQDMQLDRMLSCQTLGTGSCVIASTSITPAGTGLHAISTSKLVDLSVLPMDATLAGALSTLGAQPGTPLLDVQGVQASSDAIIDGSSSNAQATGDVTYIAVAGLVVMDHGAVNTSGLAGFVPQSELDAIGSTLPIGEPMTLEITTGHGVLTLQITLGAEQRTYTATSHQSASLGRMQVRLLNGDSKGQNPVTLLGASQPGAIVSMNTASVSSEVLGSTTTVAGSPAPSPSPDGGAGTSGGNGTLVPESTGSNVAMGQTGLFGPSWFGVGLGLFGLGALLRRRSRRAR
jgi:hypothetical protein